MVKPGSTKSAQNIRQKNPATALTAKQIVNRHIKNKNDVITEDDLKHVKIETSVPKDKAHQPLPIPSGKKRPKDEDKDPAIMTPWDVINE